MTDLAEPDLVRTPDEVTPSWRPTRSTGPWPLVGLFLLLVGLLAGYWYFRPAPSEVPPATAVADPPAAAPADALGRNPFPADVPALDGSDAFVRTWLPRVSSHPRLLAWLATDRLVRTFATVVTNIADGQSPAGRVPVLRPAGAFRIVERNGQAFIDPRSYQRYDELAQVMASLDAGAASQLYATLKPRIEEAHAELGGRGSFDDTLARALSRLLETPVVDRPLRVEPSGIGYRFADARLDALSGAQQHLLRMGPANARLVQERLRSLAVALGLPASRLPPPAP